MTFLDSCERNVVAVVVHVLVVVLAIAVILRWMGGEGEA